MILIGNGRKEDINYLNKIIGINKNVLIIKNVSDKELIDYYRKAKVTCIAAHDEPFGLTSIESQSCGTPVVTVNEGGPEETIIEGETGYISNRNEKTYLNKTILTINSCNKMKNTSVKNVLDNWTWKTTLKPLDKYFK